MTNTPSNLPAPLAPSAPQAPPAIAAPETGAPPPTADDRVVADPPPPPARRRRVVEPADVSGRDWAVVIAAGIAGDLALRRLPGANLAGTLLFTTAALGLLLTGRAPTPFARRCLAGAIGFAVMLSIRSDPRLVAFNLIASTGLIILAAAPPARWFDTRPLQGLRNAAVATGVAAGFVVELPAQARARQRRRIETGASSQTLAIVRGIVFALPMLIVLGLLLASADAVFASFIEATAFEPVDVSGHVALLALGALGMGVLLRLHATDTSLVSEPGPPRLARTEALVILVLLDALFAGFAIAQVVARVDAGESTLLDQALTSRGLTYKEHARQGFFQLLWAAGITMAALLSLRSTTLAWSRTSRAFRVLALVAVALTYVIVGVAFTRLQLYIGDNGLTPLRFYSSVFSIWIGVGFALVALRLLDWKPDQAWMLPALATSGMAALALLNAVNPEAIIAGNNLERNERSLLRHVDKLSGDGLSVVVDGIDGLDPALRLELTEQLCAPPGHRRGRPLLEDAGPFDWNLGSARGRAAVNELCPAVS